MCTIFLSTLLAALDIVRIRSPNINWSPSHRMMFTGYRCDSHSCNHRRFSEARRCRLVWQRMFPPSWHFCSDVGQAVQIPFGKNRIRCLCCLISHWKYPGSCDPQRRRFNRRSGPSGVWMCRYSRRFCSCDQLCSRIQEASSADRSMDGTFRVFNYYRCSDRRHIHVRRYLALVLLDQSASRWSYRCHGPALPRHSETYQAHTGNMERDFTTARSTRIWLIAFFAHLLHTSLANGVARHNRGMTDPSLRPWWCGLH
jgi:hypothetical protein